MNLHLLTQIEAKSNNKIPHWTSATSHAFHKLRLLLVLLTFRKRKLRSLPNQFLYLSVQKPAPVSVPLGCVLYNSNLPNSKQIFHHFTPFFSIKYHNLIPLKICLELVDISSVETLFCRKIAVKSLANCSRGRQLCTLGSQTHLTRYLLSVGDLIFSCKIDLMVKG